MRGQTFFELNRLLDAGLDLPASERSHWIEALPCELDALKPRLRKLILRASRASRFLETMPKLDLVPESSLVADAECERAGECIGPYRLTRILGSGGMATVWLARRTDGLIDRDVALKIPNGTWQRSGLAERMAREREILAALNHPNIGRLYDAGLTVDGKPYLALEYLEGQPIDAYCADRHLDLRARLRLFAQVAHAVAYAHGKLIVHRDLKPANILVGADGQVRLLDFGIARLLDGDSTIPSALTELTGRALTPDYASPEQISGQPVTVASDVYSLGVVLYELLTGARPYALKSSSRRALEDAILQCEPQRPSDIVTCKAVKRALRGDIDTIALKALKKESDERYATVDAFAEDIHRYLRGLPVQARPDSVWYRLQRFAGRNRFAVAAYASVVVALLVGSGLALSQMRLAIAERGRAERVRDFVVSLLRQTDPYARADGAPLAAADLLLTARERVDRELPEQPGVAAELQVNIAESLEGLGRHEEAAQTLEQTLLNASATGLRTPTLARAHRLLSEIYASTGHFDDARRHLGIALASPGAQDHTREAIALQLQRSALAVEGAHFSEALDASQTALRLAQVTPGANARDVAQAWRYSAVVYRAQGDATRAIDGYRRAYELALAAYHQDVRHPFVMETRMGYARALMMENRWPEALVHMRAAVEASTETFGADADLTGNFLGSLGDVQVRLGYIREGLQSCRKALAIYEAYSATGTRGHAARLRLLGRALLAARRSEEAAEVLGRAVAMRSDLDDPYELPVIRLLYVNALLDLGRLDDAARELSRIPSGKTGVASQTTMETYLQRGVLHRHRGEFSDAMSDLNSALALAQSNPRALYDQARILHESGLVHFALGQYDMALLEHRRAAELIRQVQPRATPALADSLTAVGRALHALGRHREAAQESREAAALWRQFQVT